jgi:hypothetical protein
LSNVEVCKADASFACRDQSDDRGIAEVLAREWLWNGWTRPFTPRCKFVSSSARCDRETPCSPIAAMMEKVHAPSPDFLKSRSAPADLPRSAM